MLFMFWYRYSVVMALECLCWKAATNELFVFKKIICGLRGKGNTNIIIVISTTI